MLPDAARMLADVPGSLHVTVKDAGGEWRDAVKVGAALRPQLGEFGRLAHPDSESVFVRSPFSEPESRIAIRLPDGAETTRYILSVQANPVFTEIEIGEEA